MELGLVTETWGADDQTWLGSRHGTGNARSVTLLFGTTEKFVKTNYEETDTYKGFVPSGTPLALSTEAGANLGHAIPYVQGGSTNGNGVLAGFLLSPVKLPSGVRAVGALLDHGRVRFARLPGNGGATQAQLQTAAGSFFRVEA